jgi:hypothetical protein
MSVMPSSLTQWASKAWRIYHALVSPPWFLMRTGAWYGVAASELRTPVGLCVCVCVCLCVRTSPATAQPRYHNTRVHL